MWSFDLFELREREIDEAPARLDVVVPAELVGPVAGAREDDGAHCGTCARRHVR